MLQQSRDLTFEDLGSDLAYPGIFEGGYSAEHENEKQEKQITQIGEKMDAGKRETAHGKYLAVKGRPRRIAKRGEGGMVLTQSAEN